MAGSWSSATGGRGIAPSLVCADLLVRIQPIVQTLTHFESEAGPNNAVYVCFRTMQPHIEIKSLYFKYNLFFIANSCFHVPIVWVQCYFWHQSLVWRRRGAFIPRHCSEVRWISSSTCWLFWPCVLADVASTHTKMAPVFIAIFLSFLFFSLLILKFHVSRSGRASGILSKLKRGCSWSHHPHLASFCILSVCQWDLISVGK